MPISSFMGLQTALRGLLAQQRALEVTSHNVSNANTVGYSRQEATMAATPGLKVPAGALQSGGGAMLGTGVDVEAYRRIRDTFIDLQYRAQLMTLGDAATKTRSLDQAELTLSEPGENGIGHQLGQFWSAWADLSNAPESPATRRALVDQAATLSASLNRLSAQFSTVQTQASAEYSAITGASGDVASMANEIAKLNAAIKDTLRGGGTANDLMDRRDLLVDKLAKLAQVSVTDLSTGAISLNFGDAAAPLVNDGTVTWPQVLTAPGGKLGALLSLSSATGTLASYKTDLNNFAKSLADTVNALHAPPNFFSYTLGNEAATLAVAVTSAAVRASVTAAPGANDIALAVAALRGGAAEASYQTLVTRIGSDVQDARRREATAEVLTNALEDRRQSTSGVSLDEEMQNIVRFQRGYQASARAMSTMDEMLDVLINRTGRVGL